MSFIEIYDFFKEDKTMFHNKFINTIYELVLCILNASVKGYRPHTNK